MDEERKSPKEIFQSLPVVSLGWTQVPDPEMIFGRIDLKLKYLKEKFRETRKVYDDYMASLIYAVILKDNEKNKTKHTNLPKYAVLKDRKPDKRYHSDLPTTKEALPNHIAKDKRDEIPTVEECVRVRRENADYNRIYRFGKAA